MLEALSCLLAVFISAIALLFVFEDRALKFTWQRTLFKQLGPPSWKYPKSMLRSQNFLFKLPAVAGLSYCQWMQIYGEHCFSTLGCAMRKTEAEGGAEYGKHYSLASKLTTLVKTKSFVACSLIIKALHWFCNCLKQWLSVELRIPSTENNYHIYHM